MTFSVFSFAATKFNFLDASYHLATDPETTLTKHGTLKLSGGKGKMRDVAFNDELESVSGVRPAGDGESSGNEDEDEDKRLPLSAHLHHSRSCRNPPSHNIHAIVRAQIVFLFSTLMEDNFDRNQAEIHSVCLEAFSVTVLLILISCIHSYPNNMGSKPICILSGI